MTWKPVPQHIATPFAESVSPDDVSPEHARPQMVRQHWQTLNGLWDYAVESADGNASSRQRNGTGKSSSLLPRMPSLQ